MAGFGFERDRTKTRVIHVTLHRTSMAQGPARRGAGDFTHSLSHIRMLHLDFGTVIAPFSDGTNAAEWFSCYAGFPAMPDEKV